jgi:hypothetical protein
MQREAGRGREQDTDTGTGGSRTACWYLFDLRQLVLFSMSASRPFYCVYTSSGEQVSGRTGRSTVSIQSLPLGTGVWCFTATAISYGAQWTPSTATALSYMVRSGYPPVQEVGRSDWPIPVTHSLHLLPGDMRHAAHTTTAYALVLVHGAAAVEAKANTHTRRVARGRGGGFSGVRSLQGGHRPRTTHARECQAAAGREPPYNTGGSAGLHRAASAASFRGSAQSQRAQLSQPIASGRQQARTREGCDRLESLRTAPPQPRFFPLLNQVKAQPGVS